MTSTHHPRSREILKMYNEALQLQRQFQLKVADTSVSLSDQEMILYLQALSEERKAEEMLNKVFAF